MRPVPPEPPARALRQQWPRDHRAEPKSSPRKQSHLHVVSPNMHRNVAAPPLSDKTHVACGGGGGGGKSRRRGQCQQRGTAHVVGAQYNGNPVGKRGHPVLLAVEMAELASNAEVDKAVAPDGDGDGDGGGGGDGDGDGDSDGDNDESYGNADSAWPRTSRCPGQRTALGRELRIHPPMTAAAACRSLGYCMRVTCDV